MTTLTLYVDNSMELQLTNLVDSSGTAVSGATVEATIYESDGVTLVTGATWPVSMAYSGGIYSASLPYGLAITSGHPYRVQVVATLGNARLDESLYVVAKNRYAQ